MIFAVLAIFGALAASYTDIKKGIIQNKLTLPLFMIGLVGNLAVHGREIAMELSLSVGLIFSAGYIFWRIGGWSAGDAKEFLFLAALLPRYPEDLRGIFNPVLTSYYPFIITVFFNTFLAIFPFILIWGIYLSFSTSSQRLLLEPIRKWREAAAHALILSALLSLTQLLRIHPLFVIVLLAASYKLKQQLKIGISLLIMGWFLYSTGKTLELTAYYATTILAILLLRLLWNSITVIRTEGLTENIKVTELEEGMILSEEIYTGKDKIHKWARGLNTEEIEKIKSMSDKGEIGEELKIKRAAPFAPVIFIGLMISLIAGDMVVMLSG